VWTEVRYKHYGSGDWQFREATAVEARAYLGSAGIQHRRVFVDDNGVFDRAQLQNCIDVSALTHIDCDAFPFKLLEGCASIVISYCPVECL